MTMIVALVAAFLATFLLLEKHLDSVTSWVLWNLRCRRGARCAHPVVGLDEQMEMEDDDQLVVHMHWQCGGCGTVYCEHTLVTKNAISPMGKERIG
jgi:hypothetical protein